jgi:hypothetical protein
MSPARATRPGPRKSALRVVSLPGGAISPQNVPLLGKEPSHRNCLGALSKPGFSAATFTNPLSTPTIAGMPTRSSYRRPTMVFSCGGLPQVESGSGRYRSATS